MGIFHDESCFRGPIATSQICIPSHPPRRVFHYRQVVQLSSAARILTPTFCPTRRNRRSHPLVCLRFQSTRVAGIFVTCDEENSPFEGTQVGLSLQDRSPSRIFPLRIYAGPVPEGIGSLAQEQRSTPHSPRPCNIVRPFFPLNAKVFT